MIEKKIIEELAEPILEKLKEMESSLNDGYLTEIPRVHFIKPQESQPVMLGSMEINSDVLDELEIYLQNEIEKMAHPCVLH